MRLISSDFEDGGEIPAKFTCQGEGSRPNLTWSEVPAEAKGLAISLVDPDVPGGNFVHWVVINIPAAIINVAPNETVGEELPNSGGKAAYVPPCPPSGKHRYIFTLYALDADRVGVSSYEGFLEAAKPHIIDEVTLTGLYEKNLTSKISR